MLKPVTFSGFIFLFIACGGDKRPATVSASVMPPVKPKIALPNTPETVVVAWEGWIANNQYEYAAYVSVDKELDYVTTMEKSQAIEPLPPSKSQTLDIKCATTGDSAVCTCTVRNPQYGDDHWKYFLVKRDGQWMLRDVVPNGSERMGASVKNTQSIQ